MIAEIDQDIREKPLLDYLDAGLFLIPSKPDGRPLIKWKGQARQEQGIRTRQEIQDAWNKGIRRFQFIPADIDMLVIDLDNKNGKDGSGKFTEKYPHIFTPVYVETPTNKGRHLYFRVSDKVKQELQSYSTLSGDMGNGIEIIYDKHPCTAAGSSKAEGRYTLHGRLDYASDLHTYPKLLADIIQTFKPAPAPPSRPKRYRQRTKGQRTFDQIAEYLRDEKGKIPARGNRNPYCFSFACCARNQEHPILDTIGYLQAWLEAEDFPLAEIQATVNSAYRGKAGL